MFAVCFGQSKYRLRKKLNVCEKLYCSIAKVKKPIPDFKRYLALCLNSIAPETPEAM